jgi:tripartite-type tricarboxylate transporter receptor subunit TctC
MIIRILFCMLIVAGPLWGASLAGAQAVNYPTKPVILQVPWPAGGSTDIGARIVAAIAEKKMGQPIVVTNRVGAGSQIGLTETARAKPDGYFLGFASLPALNTIILDPERKALFNLNSLVFIINQVVDPGIIWSTGDCPYKTLKDLIDDARKRPGVIRAATTGILGDDHLAILMLEQAAKIKFRIVHFDGGAQVFTAVMGKQVDVAFGNVGDIGTKLKGTTFRILIEVCARCSHQCRVGLSQCCFFLLPRDLRPGRHPGPDSEEDPDRLFGGHEGSGAYGQDGQGSAGRPTPRGRGIQEIRRRTPAADYSPDGSRPQEPVKEFFAKGTKGASQDAPPPPKKLFGNIPKK